MKTYTKKQFLADGPCAEAVEFATSCKFSARKAYEVCERGDWLIWLLRRSDNLTKPQAVQIAIAVAEHVLPVYEKRYPNDKRPRQAIEAVRQWLTDPTPENAEKCRTAAYAAYAAAADAADAAAAGRLSERKWQADKIRELIPNPFK